MRHFLAARAGEPLPSVRAPLLGDPSSARARPPPGPRGEGTGDGDDTRSVRLTGQGEVLQTRFVLSHSEAL